MTDLTFNIPGWHDWLKRSQFVASKIGVADESNVQDYFSRVHAATEALLRQILFIGFRLNKATYKAASDWIYHNDITPDRKKYPALFNKLYADIPKTWDGIIGYSANLSALWPLWHDYSKIIRNHVQHGIRKHSEESLRYATLIDQALMMELDEAFVSICNGRISASIDQFNPRLPRGSSSLDLNWLAGVKKSGQRPKPIKDVQQCLATISLFKITTN